MTRCSQCEDESTASGYRPRPQASGATGLRSSRHSSLSLQRIRRIMRLQRCTVLLLLVGCAAVAVAVCAQPGPGGFPSPSPSLGGFGGLSGPSAPAPSFASPSPTPSPSLSPSTSPVAVGSANIGGAGLPPNNAAPIGSAGAGLPPSASIISPGFGASPIGAGAAPNAVPVTASPSPAPVTTPAGALPSTAVPSIAAASPVLFPVGAAAAAPVSNPAAAIPSANPSHTISPAISVPLTTGGAVGPSRPIGVTATAVEEPSVSPVAPVLVSDPPPPFSDRPEATTMVEQIFGPYPYDLAAFMSSNVSLYPTDLSLPSSPLLPALILEHPSVGPNATDGVQTAADFALSCTGRDTSQPFLDGACNNLNVPWWGQVCGAAQTALPRSPHAPSRLTNSLHMVLFLGRRSIPAYRSCSLPRRRQRLDISHMAQPAPSVQHPVRARGQRANLR